MDLEYRALLLERLGEPLANLGLPVDAQIDVLADTIPRSWGSEPIAGLLSGLDQLDHLENFISEQASTTDAASRRTVETAKQCIDRRRTSLDRTALVVVHGDAHPTNVLATDDSSFRLIDPEGLMSEPAHDLGIPLRGWSDELLRHPNPVAVHWGWCHRITGRNGVDPAAVWEWSFIERVSTGLLLAHLGLDEAAELLASARHLAEAWGPTGIMLS